MAETILELQDVSKSFGDYKAVTDVSLMIEKGEFIAIMGPSGCGKTTTLRMIAGLDTPTKGQIRLWNRDVSQDAPWERDTPLVWQNYALFPFMTVHRNVEFGLKQRGMPTRERAAKAEEWMTRMGIAQFSARMPGQLSGGQKQRVALARALATEPQILLLDEPLSALDPHLKVSMQAELVRLHRELGITFVCVTHSHSEAVAMADRVVIMNRGSVQQVGPPREIHRRAQNRFVAEFLGASNILDVTVSGRKGNEIVAESRFGILRIPAGGHPDFAPGHPLALVVATDQVELSRTPDQRNNQIHGRIATLEVLGASITAIVDVGHGTLLKSQLSSRDREADALAIGDEVYVSWSPNRGYIVAGEAETPTALPDRIAVR